MYKALSPGTIGVRPRDLREAVAWAGRHGFGGVEVGAREVADLVEQEGAAAVRSVFAAAGVRPAGFGLPIDWRGATEAWRAGVEALPRLARAAAAIGATRCMTWILPGSDERPPEENRRFHVERLTPPARILADAGCRLGLEFLGPKTLRDGRTYPFIHTMREMLALGAEIGPNVGLLLDSWHWYTSHATLDDVRTLRPEQVVYVHVNDAPAGVPVDEQIDNVRALPGETGVIDITGFLRALQAIGYDGPVVPEPFKQDLRALPSDEARLAVVSAAIDGIFRKAGLA